MQVFQGIAELEKTAGAHLGYSDWHTVTQEQITLFADARCSQNRSPHQNRVLA